MRLRREHIIENVESFSNDDIEIGSVSQETLEAYILQNHKLDISPEELAARLDDSFVRAIEAQVNALKDGGEGVRRRADVVARIAACEGMGNKKVFNKHGDYAAEGYISVNDFKLSQIEAVLANVGSADDAVIIETAVRNICSVYQIDFSVSRMDAMKTSLKENRHIQHLVATTAFVGAVGVASVVMASPAAADDTLIVNTKPTKPSPHVNEIANGDVVKIVAKTIDKSQQDLAPGVVLEDVVTVKTAPAKVISAPKPKEASTKTTSSDDVVYISKNVIDTPKKISSKAPVDQSEKSDDPVITIKPIPVVPIPKTPTPEVDKAAIPEPQKEAISAPAASPEISAAQAVAKIGHNDLSPELQDILPRNTNWNNTGRMLEYLMTHAELTDSQAIGVVTNAMWESGGVNPGQNQIGGPAFGLVQWEGARRTALEAYAAEKNMPAADLYVQLDFMIMELKRDGWNGYAELKQAKTSTEATLIFMRKFERPGVPHEQGRLKISKALTDLFNERLSTFEAGIDKKATDEKAAADAGQVQRAAQQEKTVDEFKGWKYPVPDGSPITSEFGPRGAGRHDGEDFGVRTGTPFFAAAGGTVKVITYDVSNMPFCKEALGNLGQPMSVIKDPIQKEVRVTTMIDGDEYVTIYAHMSEVTVAPNEIVKAGQVLGKTGGSGCSTGPHAHFEVRKNGKPIDPKTLFEGDTWQTMGDIKPSSVGETVESTTTDQHDTEQAGDPRVQANDETISETSEPVSQSAAENLDASVVDEQKRRLVAVKQVAEFKKRLADSTQAETAVTSDGYLSVQR